MQPALDIPRREQEQLAVMLAELERRQKGRAAHMAFDAMYGWQREFVEATANYFECCLCAANQIGKTYVGRVIDAFHLLGEYPEDWPGHRFAHAPLCWVLGYSMEKTRDLTQTGLFGAYNDGKWAGGLIPADRIVDWESAPGTPNAMRTVRVKHSSGATSVVQFWSYSQGQHALMGDVVDWFHVDEEPRDQSIRPQLLTRVINGDNKRGGRGIYTLTPENGRTELVLTFMENATSSQFFMQKGWDDAPHITEEKRERMLAAYPAHQRDMRSKGVPMLGHGRIYEFSDDFVECDHFDIPDHWYLINGIDFGWDHPQAHIQLAEDRDNGVFYVVHSFKARHISALQAWDTVKPWSEGIPTSWPHDGLQHEKGRDAGAQQRQHYQEAGFNMLHDFAKWPVGGNGVEAGIFEIRDHISKGRFKFFRGQPDLMNEFRQYHRDENGKIVKKMDDMMDAIRYAYMMRRYAIQKGYVGKPAKIIQFAGWGR